MKTCPSCGDDITGAVLSMLIPPTVVQPLLPALSYVQSVTDWSRPSVPIVVLTTGPGHVMPSTWIHRVSSGTPDRSSWKVHWTVTVVLYHPFWFGSGRTLHETP